MVDIERKPNRYGFINYGGPRPGSKENPSMPIHDAPAWNMPEAAVNAVYEVAPAQRVFLRQLIDTLERNDTVSFHDSQSFAAEVVAAQVNLLVDRLRERRSETHPHQQFSDSDITNIMVSDIMNRALLRRLRGDDK